MLHKWLENDVDEAIRDQLQINFIFFTDGEFNTIRSYIRGPGFGSNKTNQAVMSTPQADLSVHNTFHDYDPIVARDLNVTFEGKNLSTIFGSYAHPVDVPGVNSCFNMGDLSSSGSNWQWLPKGTNSEASDTSSRWRGQLIFPFRSVAYREDDLTGNWQSKIHAGIVCLATRTINGREWATCWRPPWIPQTIATPLSKTTRAVRIPATATFPGP
jgi:hypothetical protein